ncbi:hypothetical protein BV898_05899 [Hypsibius exemplaris]|uniref:NodB homology domain-containing protein n=1 Tax=Hypsibius exemplaris TaxID=2072580 RepID=A0A1W0WY31_HYPEX|nr:hypothetical protein BV898_05899 [Hypsibius exemplaris]
MVAWWPSLGPLKGVVSNSAQLIVVQSPGHGPSHRRSRVHHHLVSVSDRARRVCVRFFPLLPSVATVVAFAPLQHGSMAGIGIKACNSWLLLSWIHVVVLPSSLLFQSQEPWLFTLDQQPENNGSLGEPHPVAAAPTWTPSNLDAELDNALYYSDDAGGSGASILPGLAEPCNKTACQLPNCYCDSSVIPGGLSANQTPQMLVIAFDGAINMHNYDLYTQIFNEDRRNPNGCPIRATFYLSHRWTDYSNVQNLYALGHEIALRGVALTGDEANATYESFTEDIIALQQIARNFADVNPDDVVGMRAPYLKTEGDDQFLAAFDTKLLYDSSILNPSLTPVWPFTLDYAMPFTCPTWYPRCPMLSYPGLWEIPVTRLVGPAGVPYGFFTAYEFSKNPIEIADILMKFFLTHYTTNRAPFTLNGLSYWFVTPEFRLGYELFLEQVLRLPDVWMVTSTQLIHWMQNPTAASEMNAFEPFKCDTKRDVELCQTPRSCRTFLDGEEIYFTSCKRCPYTFPYLKNFNGDAERSGLALTRCERDAERSGSALTRCERDAERSGLALTRCERGAERSGSALTRCERDAERSGSALTRCECDAETLATFPCGAVRYFRVARGC